MVQENKEEKTQSEAEVRKPYVKPQVVHELELETRAGSPLRFDPVKPQGK
jgi:hypothetical protein